jgi:hypothetical protein
MNDYFIGNPEDQIDTYVTQDRLDNCAVAAQTNVINQFLHSDISLDEANYVAYSNGWYEPGYGTSWDNLGKLMDHYGVDYHSVENASIQQLAQELQAGNRVVIPVNSGELWDQGFFNDFKNWLVENLGLDSAQFTPADHAVVVTGIDMSDPNNPMVLINDPGVPDGAAMRYPADQFMDAWENSGFDYVATTSAPGANALGDFDLGTFLGVGTSIAYGGFTGDWATANAAGNWVHQITDSVNWDDVLRSV